MNHKSILFLDLSVSPLQPWHQSLYVCCLDSSTTPDTNRGRGIAVSTNVEGYILLFKKGNKCLDLLRGEIKCAANRSIRTRRRVFCKEIDPFVLADKLLNYVKVVVANLDESVNASNALSPGKSINIILDSHHRRGIYGSTLEETSIQFSLLGETENLRKRAVVRRVSLQSLNSTRAEDKHSVCTLSTKNFLPRIRRHVQLFPGHVHCKNGRSRITKGKPSSIIRDPITSVRNTNSRSSSVESEANITIGTSLFKIWKLSISSSVLYHVHSLTELEVRHGVRKPSLSE
mmetsp:Transcript_23842/g.48683  ORF Transcript_23842/g.48683 Transcript_23842/m.48683 type:complete len:288 (+) Transcript_23842:3114-3977(+)